MVSSALRLASLLAAAAVVLSFGAFASEQAGAGSKATVARIAEADASDAPGAAAQVKAVPASSASADLDEPAPSPRVERLRERKHGGLRERIDDVNDTLTAPFKSLAGSGSIWDQRIVTSLLALLVFGVGLGFAGRYAATRGV